MQLRPSNELHRHRIQDATMKGRRQTAQWWDSHEAWIWSTDNMASFYLRKNTLLSYGKDQVVMNVGVPGVPVIVRTKQNTLLAKWEVLCSGTCHAQQPPCLKSVITFLKIPSFIDPQHLPHHLLRTLSNWTIRHNSGEIFITKASSLFLHIAKSKKKRAMEWRKSRSFP